MKIKIGLYLPFQKLEQYNIETDLDDIIQALPNCDINKQEILDYILKYGHYDSLSATIIGLLKDPTGRPQDYHEDRPLPSYLRARHSLEEADGYCLSLRRNSSAEIILTHPIYNTKEVAFLNNLNALEDDKFFHIKIHYYNNVKSGEKYSEIVIDGEENQTTLLIGGPYDTSNTIANEKEIAKYADALNANLIEKMKDETWRKDIDNDKDELISYSQYLIRLKDFKFDEWLDKLLLRRKEIAGKIKLSDELVKMMDLLKSGNDISIKLYSCEEWYGTYIDSEGDEEEEGDFTTEAEGVVSKDFLLDKLNEYVKQRIEEKIRNWLEFNSDRGALTIRNRRESTLDNEDWLKDIIANEEPDLYGLGELDIYDFAEWIEVSQCFDVNPDIFEATDVEYSQPWNWDFDDREIEAASVYLEFTSGNEGETFYLY